MPQNPDIAFAITETLASGELVVVSELLPDHGAVRESTAHIMVQGDISGSAALETRGSIMGNLATPCCIQAGGDVIVVGSALNARISARSILIGGETRNCQLGTLGSATILHNLANSEITLGDLGPNQPLIQNATSALTQLIEHRDILTRQIGHIRTKGLDDMRALQKAAIPDDLAIIAIPSRNSAESVSSATGEGAADVILKPFTAAELIDKVEAVLAGKAERT